MVLKYSQIWISGRCVVYLIWSSSSKIKQSWMLLRVFGRQRSCLIHLLLHLVDCGLWKKWSTFCIPGPLSNGVTWLSDWLTSYASWASSASSTGWGRVRIFNCRFGLPFGAQLKTTMAMHDGSGQQQHWLQHKLCPLSLLYGGFFNQKGAKNIGNFGLQKWAI